MTKRCKPQKWGRADLKERLLKEKQKLRNNEYYDMQDTFDMLYDKSCKGFEFNDLMQHISSTNNISLRKLVGNSII